MSSLLCVETDGLACLFWLIIMQHDRILIVVFNLVAIVQRVHDCVSMFW